MSRPEVPAVIFIGQPNSGKSTLFNSIAGNKAETSNFPGTSIKHTHSRVNIEGRLLDVVDLPGTYSLCSADPAEQVVLTHLFAEKPDLVVNVVDASTLSRGLELTLELVELGYPTVVALNMVDVAERKGIEIDAAEVERLLGVPVVPTIAAHGRGVRELLDRAFEVIDKGQSLEPVRFSDDVETEVAAVERGLPPGFPVVSNPRFTAVKLIETAGHACGDFLGEVEPGLREVVDRALRAIEKDRGAPAYEVISAERHHLAMKLAEETSRVLHGKRMTWDKKIDAVLMHPVLGYVILAAVFLAFFVIIFEVGSPLETLLLGPFNRLRDVLAAGLGDGLLFHLAEGLIQGVGGGVAIVLPYFLPLLSPDVGPRGHGLPGPGRIPPRRLHAPDRAPRQVGLAVHPGLRLQRPGHRLDAHPRVAAGPDPDLAPHPLHPVLGPDDDRPGPRRLLPGTVLGHGLLRGQHPHRRPRRLGRQPVHEGAVAGAHPGDPLAQGAADRTPSCARPGSRSAPSSSSPGPSSSAAASS
ncbi:MAG: 50S ribosome-binding GTPase [Candidatus Moduliflexus flocculans]|nr:50S ribosome-binding GTPase [Candidatus Moduliflexus flocculans]